MLGNKDLKEGEFLVQKECIVCTLVLYDTAGTTQRAGCL